MAKRTATSDLNHDNWDREDDPEDAGSFSKASEEALKRRVIKVAKRRNPIPSTQNEDGKSAFGGFSGFGKTAPPPVSTAFGFLSNLTDKTEKPKTNGTPEKSETKLDEYYAKLKGLNESVTEWIKKHVSVNPFINLQPVFKDYDKYIAELDKMKLETETSTPSTVPKFSFGSTTSTTPKFSFGTATSNFSFETATTTAPSFSFGTTTHSPSSATTLSVTSTPFSSTTSMPFSFGTTSSSDAKFSFTSTVVKPGDDAKSEDQEEDEPPKAEFKPVVEEGHIYTTRCKVFVKKDSNYADHGVGTLYLKPVPNSEKTQLFVRADTNLGNLICNFILSEGIPMQRMGKKDVMLVCLPTPETKPPPVPILLRVKSPEEADELLKTLQKHKK